MNEYLLEFTPECSLPIINRVLRQARATGNLTPIVEEHSYYLTSSKGLDFLGNLFEDTPRNAVRLAHISGVMLKH